MEIFDEEKAQGATEYLLMLAGVLSVIVIAVVYVTGLGQSAEQVAENEENKILENIRGAT